MIGFLTDTPIAKFLRADSGPILRELPRLISRDCFKSLFLSNKFLIEQRSLAFAHGRDKRIARWVKRQTRPHEHRIPCAEKRACRNILPEKSGPLGRSGA